MFTRIVFASLIVATVATSAVQAAPNGANIDEYRAVDRWVEIFHPEQLVGPPVDPQFRKNFKTLAEPEPEPWKGVDPHPENIGVKQLQVGF